MLNTMSKLRGQVKTTGYPQTEGLLGDCMLKYGKELGEESAFGGYLSWHSGNTWWALGGCPWLSWHTWVGFWWVP